MLNLYSFSTLGTLKRLKWITCCLPVRCRHLDPFVRQKTERSNFSWNEFLPLLVLLTSPCPGQDDTDIILTLFWTDFEAYTEPKTKKRCLHLHCNYFSQLCRSHRLQIILLFYANFIIPRHSWLSSSKKVTPKLSESCMQCYILCADHALC